MTDWLAYLPSGLPQYLSQDTNGCSDYAPIDSIESQELALTGVNTQYSRRWLTQMSKTDPVNGNSEQVVFPTIAKYGLVLESSFPQSKTMSVKEFYAPPSAARQAQLLAEGQQWLQRWEVTPKYFVPFNLTDAPLIARLKLPTTFHFIEVLSSNWYYDSEYHSGKIGVCPLYGTPVAYHQIIIKPKGPVMLVFFQVKGNATLWTLDQGQWVGFSDMTAFKSYVGGRPTTIVELDQSEFNKVTINPNVHKIWT